MILNDYPWLSLPYQQLASGIINKRAHHALLINYVQGSGENEFISKLANRLLCQCSQQLEPCLTCHSCQLFLAHHHPDYDVITNEQGKRSIGIDQIRNIASKVYEKSQQGGNKVLWIKHAALMTEAAANALLKTLEEPPQNTYFILSDEHNSQLLPTIHSRCFSYFLALPKLEQSIGWLKKQHDQQYSDNELASALLLSENAPLKAATLLTPEKWQRRKVFCNHLLDVVPQNNYWQLAKTFDNEDFIEQIIWFCSLLSDALKAKQKVGRFIVNRDQVPLVRLFATKSNEKLSALYNLWLQARNQLLTVTGLNKELIVYNVLAQSELISETES
ncbi:MULTISPECIES: DNA polymerase III subunit delta' C-terminal domain-containing protein [unclassified Gilliamella]|uniref:DNA polymerase III subunit delta' C-terminal domain-containing protein n=1 Tax=unclassified Gilliamella TaxID=2685620 RepID=UPI00132BA02C|nr:MULTISPECIES: DNA polymerase III subunit delta' C-terminal domain-containing protein [unclassified Gilliamella]MWN31738.1 DNA polymerase III subunit delta' [Gilliamella sp. Pra-s60]MWP28845.1 DNA polymerase III subunit delta' [Gilliamella sp. Pra-s54]